jgi:hypothetical protein
MVVYRYSYTIFNDWPTSWLPMYTMNEKKTYPFFSSERSEFDEKKFMSDWYDRILNRHVYFSFTALFVSQVVIKVKLDNR